MSLDGYKRAAKALKEKKTSKEGLYPLSHLEDKWYNVLQTSKKQREDGYREHALKKMRLK